MSKFVGKFRKNSDYNDDNEFRVSRRKRNEHSEIKRLKQREYFEEDYSTFSKERRK